MAESEMTDETHIAELLLAILLYGIHHIFAHFDRRDSQDRLDNWRKQE